MTHEYDGSSLDLERALVRYMAERRVSRRELLQRIGAVGATAAADGDALAAPPVVQAATTGARAAVAPTAAIRCKSCRRLTRRSAM